MQNAICLFPLPVKTPQPVCHLGTLRPAVLGVFRNWIPNFQRVVSHVKLTRIVLPSSFCLSIYW